MWRRLIWPYKVYSQYHLKWDTGVFSPSPQTLQKGSSDTHLIECFNSSMILMIISRSQVNNSDFSKILETLYSSCMQSLKHSIYIYRLLVYSYLYTIYSDSEIILTWWSNDYNECRGIEVGVHEYPPAPTYVIWLVGTVSLLHPFTSLCLFQVSHLQCMHLNVLHRFVIN